MIFQATKIPLYRHVSRLRLVNHFLAIQVKYSTQPKTFNVLTSNSLPNRQFIQASNSHETNETKYTVDYARLLMVARRYDDLTKKAVAVFDSQK